MLAVESFSQPRAERRALGVSDGHTAPGDGLQNGPVGANREAKRQHYQPFGPLDQHEQLIALAEWKSTVEQKDASVTLSLSCIGGYGRFKSPT